MTIKVMISSTAHDLPEHRKGIIEACQVLGMMPVLAQDLPAENDGAIAASLAMVEEADIFIGIVAHRYGYVPDEDNPGGLSIPEMEYDRAVELGRPRLIFVADDAHEAGLKPEDDPQAAEKLEAFKARVMADRVVKTFKSPDHLRALVTEALTLWQQQGLEWMPEPLPDELTLPDVRDLPPGSRVLVGRAPHFVGREEIMLDLAHALLQGDPDAKTVITPAVATGAGGIGKTVLAVEFAHRFGRYFYGVHWINLFGVTKETLEMQLRAEIAACGAAMNLPGFPPDDLPAQIQMTLDAWRTTGPRLIILDNAESPEVVAKALETFTGMRVLVTSRWGEDSDWRIVGVEPRALDILTREQSIRLLRSLALHLNTAPEGELDALAERLGDYPLALHLAGRYLAKMRRVRLTIGEYVNRLEEQGTQDSSLDDWGEKTAQPGLMDHHRRVRFCFALSWEKLDNTLAQKLFRACGYLAPNTPIPPDLLLEIAKGRHYDESPATVDLRAQLRSNPALADELRRLMDDEVAFAGVVQRVGGGNPAMTADRLRGVLNSLIQEQIEGLPEDRLATALTQLVQFGLLTPDKSSGGDLLVIHPLLADYARRLDVEMDEDEQQLDEVTLALGALSKDALETRLPANFDPLRPHIEAVAEQAMAARNEFAILLWNNLGSHLRDLGDYEGAREHLENVRVLVEDTYGDDNPLTAMLLSNLGGVLADLGEMEPAREYLEQSIAIKERTIGPDDPSVAISLNNLATVLQSLGDLQGARRSFERAIAIWEREVGRDHPQIAFGLNNLGGVLYRMGDVEGARDYCAQALAIGERTLGAENPEVAIWRGNLGTLLHKMGDESSARTHVTRALRTLEATLPPGHPQIQLMRDRLDEVGGELDDPNAPPPPARPAERRPTLDELRYFLQTLGRVPKR